MGYSPLRTVPQRMLSPVPQRMLSPVPQRMLSPVPHRMLSPVPQRMLSPVPQRMLSPVPQRMLSPVPQRMLPELTQVARVPNAMSPERMDSPAIRVVAYLRRFLSNNPADSRFNSPVPPESSPYVAFTPLERCKTNKL